MSKVNSRLGRIERNICRLGGGVCPLCWGEPHATIRVMHERDPNGLGFRKTGDCFLIDDDNRITDDLRCRRCGTRALQCHLMAIGGIGPKPEGRRVCAV